MSRIIKEGTLQEQFKGCPICGCRFGYDRRDILEERNYFTVSYSVECPYCHEQLRVNVKGGTRVLLPDSDFLEDVKALAAQYGLKIDNIEVSNNN